MKPSQPDDAGSPSPGQPQPGSKPVPPAVVYALDCLEQATPAQVRRHLVALGYTAEEAADAVQQAQAQQEAERPSAWAPEDAVAHRFMSIGFMLFMCGLMAGFLRRYLMEHIPAGAAGAQRRDLGVRPRGHRDLRHRHCADARQPPAVTAACGLAPPRRHPLTRKRESQGAFPLQRISREQARKYAFDWRDEPLLRVRPGESVRDRNLRRQHRLLQDRRRTRRSPAGGPASIAFRRWPTPSPARSIVEGAERGDALVVAHRRHRRGRLLLDRHRPAPRPARRIDALAGTVRRLHHQDLPPHARPQRHHARRHPALQRQASPGRSRRSSARSASLPTAR